MDAVELQRITLESYNRNAEEYVAKDAGDDERTSAYWAGIQHFLGLVKPNQTIFEIGSGTGSDARRIEAAGFVVVRSDAAEAFLEVLRQQGHTAQYFDVLQGPTPAKFSAVLANAVLLHFTIEQFRVAARNLHDSLLPQGLLCIGMKLGDFEGWREKGLSGKRYFKFWQLPALESELTQAQFEIVHSFVAQDNGFAVLTLRKV